MSEKPKIVVGSINNRRKVRLPSRKVLLVLAFIIALSLGGFLIWNNRNQQTDSSEVDASVSISEELATMNEYSQAGNDSRAAEHARQALAHAPDDIDTMLAVAEVIEKDNPEEAGQLYAKALEIFRQQDDPDAEGKSPVTYWSAGVLAEGARLTDQAIVYFNKALEVADPSNTDHVNIIAKSQEALGRLQ